MPELPEVETTRRLLEDLILGKEIHNLEVFLPRMLKRGETQELIGKTVSEITRRGKFLQFTTDTRFKFFIHLRMTGTLLWRELSADLPSHSRFSFTFKDGRLIFRDIRTLGGVWVDDGDFVPWKNLGPEPLGDDLSVSYLKEKFKKRRIPIKVALLDQSIIAGIGNIYASEILYDCRISPLKSTARISTRKINQLLTSTRKVLTAAIKANGTTMRDFRLTNGKGGSFAQFLKVYNKENLPCESCQKPVVRIVQAKRSTYYCPSCQK